MPPIQQSHNSCSHTSGMAVGQLIRLLPSSHSPILSLQGGSLYRAWWLASVKCWKSFHSISSSDLPHSMFSFYFFIFFQWECLVFFHFSNLNSLLLSLSPLRQSPGGLVHILSSYCVSSFSLWHKTTPSEYPAFSQGAGENGWLTPFYSVYSKVPRQGSSVADNRSFTWSRREGLVSIQQKKKRWPFSAKVWHLKGAVHF